MRDPFSLVGLAIEGRYRIDAVIGEGGFGVVYRGLHERFDHPIAVKCLKIPSHFTADAKTVFLQRFREEGRILLKLADAPGVPRVYDYDVHVLGGLEIPFLVMEWLDGRTLESVLESRRGSGEKGLAPSDAIALLLPAIDAIAIAHEHQIAHRDIKPANLFLANSSRGQVVKVLDFGIAKAMQEGETLAQAQTKTATSFRAFTPNYAAPEQFTPKRFGASGPWTDVHALGLVLVELLTDRPANPGEDLVECLESATNLQRPSPQGRGAVVSAELEAVVMRAVALSTDARYRDATAFAAALRAVPEAQDISSRASLATLRLLDEAPHTVRQSPLAGSTAIATVAPSDRGGRGGTQPIATKQGVTNLAEITVQPVSSTGPRTPAVPLPPVRSSRSASKTGPLPYALGAIAVAGIGIAAFAFRPPAPGEDASETSSPSSSAASSAKAPAPSQEIVLARGVLNGREILAVLPVDQAAVKGQHHQRITRASGKVTMIEAIDPSGGVRMTETVTYPVAGGWDKTVKNSRGVLVETVHMTQDGIETHVNRAGSPFTNGCARLAWKFDEKGHPVERTCQNVSGHTIIDAKGCQIVRQELDDRHLVKSAGCFSYDGKPLSDSDGIHLSRATHDERGNTTESAFFDDKGLGVANFEGCMRVRVEYDGAGNKVELRCIGSTGLTSTLRGSKMAYVRNEYDERGCPTKLEQHDADGAPATTVGIANVVSLRDEHCGETSRATTDPKGNIVAPPNYPAKIDKTFDSEGNAIEQRCFDAKSQPVHCEGEKGSSGSVLRFEYDDKGREISSKAFDATGKPTPRARNYPHEQKKTYDERGLVLDTRYFNEKGEPATALGTIAKRAYRYDALGAEISQAGFGIDGAAVVDATLTHEIRTSYNERHQIGGIEVRDAAGGHPVRVSLHYAGMTWPASAVRLEVVREDVRTVENKFFDKSGRELSKVDCRSLDAVCIR